MGALSSAERSGTMAIRSVVATTVARSDALGRLAGVLRSIAAALKLPDAQARDFRERLIPFPIGGAEAGLNYPVCPGPGVQSSRQRFYCD